MPMEMMYGFQGAFAMGAVVLAVQYLMWLRSRRRPVTVSPPDAW